MKSAELEKRRRMKAEAKEILSAGAPTARKDPAPTAPVAPPPEPKEAANKPSAIVAKHTLFRKRHVGQIRDLEMEFSAKHSALLGKPVEPCLSCPDYCYMGESDEEEMGEVREMGTYFEDMKRKGQTPEEVEEARKQAQKTMRVTREMVEDAKLLLTLMGVPVLLAPSEAEAQCAALVKAGKADAVASEDMDSLAGMLQELGLTHPEFIDLCILLGCDYCNTLSGVGPVRGFQLIKQFGTLEKVVECVQTSGKKWTVPEDFNYPDARQLLLNPEVINAEDIHLQWNPPDEDQVRTFLTETKGFAQIKVETGLKRIRSLQGRPMQTRLDIFFAETPTKRGAIGVADDAQTKRAKVAKQSAR